MKPLDILIFSAFSDKSLLCQVTADIYKQLLKLSLKKECTIIGTISLQENEGKVKAFLRTRGNRYYYFSKEKCLNKMIEDVILFLKREGTYRLLKYFARTVYKHFRLKHKTRLGHMLEVKTIIGLYFRGIIVPAYAVWITSDIVKLSEYALQADNLVDNDRDTYYEDDVVSEPPPKRERIEYFMRYNKKIHDYGKFLKLREEKSREYLDIEFKLRTDAIMETLNELYFMIRKADPNFGIKSMEIVDKRPENISFSFLRKGRNNYCPSEWSFENYLGGGIEGPVYGTCCEKDCEYATKIVKFRPKEEDYIDIDKKNFIENCKRVREVWIEFFKAGLAPRLFETRIEKGNKKYRDEIRPYFISVSEKMDVDANHIVNDLIDNERWDLLEKFYAQIFLLIKKAHDNGLIHGDCHLGNIMIKVNDKRLLKNIERLIGELENKKSGVKMVFIDFGGSISYKFSRERIFDIILEQAEIGLNELLEKLKCFKRVGRNLSYDGIKRALEFYDYYWIVKQEIWRESKYKNRHVINIRKMFLNEMKQLKTNCKVPELQK
jgi:hypothetical protein